MEQLIKSLMLPYISKWVKIDRYLQRMFRGTEDVQMPCLSKKMVETNVFRQRNSFLGDKGNNFFNQLLVNSLKRNKLSINLVIYATIGDKCFCLKGFGTISCFTNTINTINSKQDDTVLS